MRRAIAMFLSLAFSCSAKADPENTPTAEELSSVIKGLLKTALPSPLVQQEFNWGHQRKFANGITWEKDGILRKPRFQEKMKNDGTWRKIKIEAVDPEKTLSLNVFNVQQPEKGKVTFLVMVAMQTRITFDQQLWAAGVRVYSGETRARCKPTLILACESTTRTVKNGSFFPDVIFRMRVTHAKLSYESLVVEHTAGIGGDGAKLLGETIIEFVKDIRPSLEKNMLEKANKAIVKAGDTKEVKLSLSKLLEGK
ncbi:MAG: hypothetical protein EXS09_05015 [Gemmataceae bacterium]|nr:hypothetical protein [Gemmataceae bacterium]